MIKLKELIRCLVLLILFTQVASAQTLSDYEVVKKKFIAYYNKAQYSHAYSLLSADFKRQISEEALVIFLESNINEKLGKIKSCKFLFEEANGFVYLTTFKNGKLHLSLHLNAQNEISGLQFLPISKPVQLKENKPKKLLSNNTLSTLLDKRVDSLIRSNWNDKKQVGLAIGLIQSGKVTTYGYGTLQANTATIPTKQTVMEIGSVTKTFAGLLVAYAESTGKLQLQDDIRKYLPGSYPNLVYNNKAITIQHLLTHTSGLPRLPDDLANQPDYNPLDPYKNYNQQMMLDHLHQVKLTAEPGTVASYSNYAVALLKIILETACNKSFTALLQEHIYNPMGMKRTFAMVPQDSSIERAHVYDNGHEVLPWQLGDMLAAGGLSSTVEDMLHYLTAQYQQQNDAIKKSHEVLFKENAHQGTAYLWVVTTLKDGNHLIWHNGGTGGSSSFCGFIQETGDAVVVLSNSSTNVDALAIQLLKALR